MNIAMDKHGDMVLAALAGDVNYTCPECGEGVYVKAKCSAYKRVHFSHFSDTSCGGAESDEHLYMKFWYVEKLRQFGAQNIKYEKRRYLDNGSYRQPDVAFDWNGLTYAIEIQRSKIAAEKMMTRTMDAISTGVERVFWVVCSKWHEGVSEYAFVAGSFEISEFLEDINAPSVEQLLASAEGCVPYVNSCWPIVKSKEWYELARRISDAGTKSQYSAGLDYLRCSSHMCIHESGVVMRTRDWLVAEFARYGAEAYEDGVRFMAHGHSVFILPTMHSASELMQRVLDLHELGVDKLILVPSKGRANHPVYNLYSAITRGWFDVVFDGNVFGFDSDRHWPTTPAFVMGECQAPKAIPSTSLDDVVSSIRRMQATKLQVADVSQRHADMFNDDMERIGAGGAGAFAFGATEYRRTACKFCGCFVEQRGLMVGARFVCIPSDVDEWGYDKYWPEIGSAELYRRYTREDAYTHVRCRCKDSSIKVRCAGDGCSCILRAGAARVKVGTVNWGHLETA